MESSKQGHHFAYRGNNFYKMIYGASFTDRLVPANEDETLPELYKIGIVRVFLLFT
jgi:G:T/U-mismatch repair DNA glycosylase